MTDTQLRDPVWDWPTGNAHAATVARHDLGPCLVEVGDWPYECIAKDRHPDHAVYICRAHNVWWHNA